MRTDTDEPPVEQAPIPTFTATELVGNGSCAHIILRDQTYVLRITRAGKLILTK